MSVSSRVGVVRPPRRQLIATHRRVRVALGEAQQGCDVQQVLQVLSNPYSEDADGLAELLAELGVDSPGALLDVMRMLTVSAGYTALTWAGGLTTEGGGRFSAQDVISTSWANVEWHDDAAGESDGSPEVPPLEQSRGT